MAKKNTTPADTKPVDTETAKIASTEAALVARYGNKIVPGTVRRAPEGSKYGRKLLVDIRTVGVNGKPDGNTRTVATSDVFQVHHTEEVKAELKKLQAAERRAAKAKDRPAKAPKATKGKGKKAAAEALGVEG